MTDRVKQRNIMALDEGVRRGKQAEKEEARCQRKTRF